MYILNPVFDKKIKIVHIYKYHYLKARKHTKIKSDKYKHKIRYIHTVVKKIKNMKNAISTIYKISNIKKKIKKI